MKGVTSIPFCAHAVGAAKTAQAIAANRSVVLIFVPFFRTLISDPRCGSVCVSKSPQVVTDSFTQSDEAIDDGDDCSEKSQFVCRKRPRYWF
jgi:hypothetical protein